MLCWERSDCEVLCLTGSLQWATAAGAPKPAYRSTEGPTLGESSGAHVLPSTAQKHKQPISKIIVSKQPEEKGVKYGLIVNIFLFNEAALLGSLS